MIDPMAGYQEEIRLILRFIDNTRMRTEGERKSLISRLNDLSIPKRNKEDNLSDEKERGGLYMSGSAIPVLYEIQPTARIQKAIEIVENHSLRNIPLDEVKKLLKHEELDPGGEE